MEIWNTDRHGESETCMSLTRAADLFCHVGSWLGEVQDQDEH